jgi:sugar phosphate isomerase/epimerase
MLRSRIGVIHSLQEKEPFFKRVQDFGILCCQLVSWNPELWTDQRASLVKREIRDSGIRVTAFWAGWPGPAIWDFIEGPSTLGIVPEKHRDARLRVFKEAGQFAEKIGIPAVITHLGFLPENPMDPLFSDVVMAVGEIAEHYRKLGIDFWFETGQETPLTMLRLIRSVGTPNLGINLDPANLIMYGKANPIDALDMLGPYVRNIHAKDGFYPTDPMALGAETPVGQGKVCFQDFARKLRQLGFQGEFIIEREIDGAEQETDIRATIAYLESL